MENNGKEKLLKKLSSYKRIAQVFKWLAIGLGVAAVIAGVAVGAVAGAAVGIATFFGCGLFGFACYLSSITAEGQSLSLSLQSQGKEQSKDDDMNKITINTMEKENSAETDNYKTVDLQDINLNVLPKTESKEITDANGDKYYTVPVDGEDYDVKYNTDIER